MKTFLKASLLTICVLHMFSGADSQDGGTSSKMDDIKKEVATYAEDAKAIINLAVNGKAQNRSYNRLAKFVDDVGNRVSGSENLNNAIRYMTNALKDDKLDNVATESVQIPHWVRGNESAMMILPRKKTLAILGLGSSIGTPPEGITAEVIVVSSFAELQSKAQEVKGKIVVFNQKFVSYGVTVQYRTRGASEAAKLGALATLIRSVTPASVYSPHTGWQTYQTGVKKIPTACITIEDAELMARLTARGIKVVVQLKMGAVQYPDVESFNIVAEIVGTKYPEQVVIVSGHLDTWDVGQGAMDDGGGVFISWEVFSLIKDLGFKCKRTLRLVLWTAEEEAAAGGRQYFERHKKDIANMNMVMESDTGTFNPLGIQFTGNAEAGAIMKEVMKLLAPINVTGLYSNGGGDDIALWIQAGVPGASLLDDTSTYFIYHHSEGDTMTVQNPNWMNRCAAVWATVSYVVANLEDMLPR